MAQLKALRGWKNLGPYKWHLLALALLACAEVALRVALPWPMKAVVDHALGGVPPPPWLASLAGGQRARLLTIAVLSGIVVQLLQGHPLGAQVTGTEDVGLMAADRHDLAAAHLQLQPAAGLAQRADAVHGALFGVDRRVGRRGVEGHGGPFFGRSGACRSPQHAASEAVRQ